MVRGCNESQSGVPLQMRGLLQLIVDDGLVSIECLRSEILWGSVKDTMSCMQRHEIDVLRGDDVIKFGHAKPPSPNHTR
jgi:hypothetical protein